MLLSIQVRTRNLETSKQPPNVEEQIIRKRGRRQWEKLTPKTPPKRAVKRTLGDDDNSSATTISSPGPKPKESPFTKCLRGLMSPTPKVRSEGSSSRSSVIINRVLRSTESHKSYYYSPHQPYNLRSRDVNFRNSSRTSITNETDDSGIGLTPDIGSKDTPSSTIIRSNSLPNSSSNIKRINRIRRRFDFN